MTHQTAVFAFALVGLATACGSTVVTVDSVSDPSQPTSTSDETATTSTPPTSSAPSPSSAPSTGGGTTPPTSSSSSSSSSSSTPTTEPSTAPLDPLDPDSVLRTPTTEPTKAVPPATLTPLDPIDTDTTGQFPLDPSSPRVQATIADLATRLGIGADAITIVEARAVTWGDSSLGCPQPGMRYLQQLTDGSLVILEAQGRTFRYHGGDPLLLCE